MKKTKKVTKKKTAPARAQSKPAAQRRAAAPPRRAGARSQVLPGMEQVRNRRLDNLCEAFAEHRAIENQASADASHDTDAALRVMHDADITVYKHAGVEFARVPGTEKLRARLVKDKGDAAVNAGAQHAENAGEGAGEGEDEGDDGYELARATGEGMQE